MDMILAIRGDLPSEWPKFNSYTPIERLGVSEKQLDEIEHFLEIEERKLSKENQATDDTVLHYLWPFKVFEESNDIAGYSPQHNTKEFEHSSLTVIEYNENILSHHPCPKKMKDDSDFRRIYETDCYFIYCL